MDRKIYFQIFIALTIISLIMYVYFFYFNNNEKKITKIDNNEDNLKMVKGSEDLIRDMSYYSEDNKGNKYEIKYVFKLIQKANKGIKNKNLSKLSFFLSKQVT